MIGYMNKVEKLEKNVKSFKVVDNLKVIDKEGNKTLEIDREGNVEVIVLV